LYKGAFVLGLDSADPVDEQAVVNSALGIMLLALTVGQTLVAGRNRSLVGVSTQSLRGSWSV